MPKYNMGGSKEHEEFFSCFRRMAPNTDCIDIDFYDRCKKCCHPMAFIETTMNPDKKTYYLNGLSLFVKVPNKEQVRLPVWVVLFNKEPVGPPDKISVDATVKRVEDGFVVEEHDVDAAGLLEWVDGLHSKRPDLHAEGCARLGKVRKFEKYYDKYTGLYWHLA